jgi:ubiquinone/menaquinone biosynthesis C-methylase UbiE
MISEKEYIDFINKKKDRKENSCKYDTLEKMFKTYNHDYQKTVSNNQFKSLVDDIMKNKHIYYLSNLMTLLCNFISFDDAFELVEELKSSKKNMSDQDVIKFIETHRKRNFKKNTQFYPDAKSCNPELYGLQNMCNSVSKFIRKFRAPKYLDIGCGDGRKTIKVGEMLKIAPNNIYGTDINVWGPYKKNRTFPFDFRFILDNGDLDYQDNSFDIISCMLTLHHVENLPAMLKEIKRILKPNGIILLIEHDNYTHYDAMIIEMQHTLFAFFYDMNKDYIKNPIYSKYFNSTEWEFIMFKNGFKQLECQTYINNISETKRYDQQFFAVYKHI